MKRRRVTGACCVPCGVTDRGRFLLPRPCPALEGGRLRLLGPPPPPTAVAPARDGGRCCCCCCCWSSREGGLLPPLAPSEVAVSILVACFGSFS